MADSNDPLVDELKRVKSDLRFRTWTRRRFLVVALAILFDVVASTVAVVAIIQVNHQRVQTNRQICESQNTGRANARKLWTDLFALFPVPTLPPDATPPQVAGHDRAIKRIADIQAVVVRNYAPQDCSNLYR